MLRADAMENPMTFDMDSLEGDGDFPDHLSISIDSLLEILDEEPDPSQGRAAGISEGYLQGKVAPGCIDSEGALQPRSGILGSTTAILGDSRELKSSQWHPSNFVGAADWNNESGSGYLFGSQGRFINSNDIYSPSGFNNGNLHTSQLMDSKSLCSQPFNFSSNWIGLSASEYDTSLRDSVGVSCCDLMTGNFDYQQWPDDIAKCNGSGTHKSAYGNFYSQSADFVNDIELGSELEKDFERMGGESSFQMEVKESATGSSHVMLMGKSVSNDGMYSNMYKGALANSGVEDGSMCPVSIYSSVDPDLTFPDIAHANANIIEASNIMCNASSNSPTLPADSTTDAEYALSEILPGQFFQPFVSIKREEMIQTEDEREDQMFSSQNLWTSSEIKLGTKEETLDMSSPELFIVDLDGALPDIPFAEQNKYQGKSFKCESSLDSSLSSSRSSTSGDLDRSVAYTSRKLVPDSKTLMPSKNENVFSKDERADQMLASGYKQYPSPKGIDAAIQKNPSRGSLIMDDDVDICILDDISDPVHPPPSVVHINSNPVSQRSGFTDPHQPGMGIKLKEDDERLTFRMALQDLSQPKSESSPPDGVLAVPLLRHQRIALSWMVHKETIALHCSGGILADDQGLGKTISTIALILTERSPSCNPSSLAEKLGKYEALNLDEDDDNVSELNLMNRPHNSSAMMMTKTIKRENSLVVVKGRPAAGTLVVCPTSVLRQWAEELQNKVTSKANLSVLVYHGSNRTKDPSELAKYDVVLTTYAIVSMEVPKQPLVDKDDVEKGKPDAPGPMGSLIGRKRKNPPTFTLKNLKDMNTTDSTLFESAARPLARVGWFRVVLDEAQSIKNHRTQVARACWGLRAKRRWCLSGTPIQNAVDDLYSYFRFLRYDPYAVYKSFCSKIKVPISRNPTDGFRKLQAVLKTIMLRRTKGTLLDGEPIITLPPKTVTLKKVDFSKDERAFYSRLEAESREQFKVYADSGTVKENYVNILLMLLRLRQACDHPLLVKGYDYNTFWRSSLEIANKLPRDKQMDLLSCLEACLAICTICNDAPEDAVVAICGHVFCNQCICHHLTGDDNICPSAQCKVQLNVASVFSRSTLKSSLSGLQGHDCAPGNSDPELVDSPTLNEDCPSSDSSKIKAALEILQSLPKSQYPSLKGIYGKPNDGGSGFPDHSYDTVSVGCLVDIDDNKHSGLEAGSNSQVSEKAIVFSQWTRMLDLLEVPLKGSCIQYRRLDGTMSVAARDKAVKDFNTRPEVTVMIMSLKAASLGLNMVAACHVLLLDLWWNPTTEDQAIDRAHRIGQTRPVIVSRLTVKDTVEDRILALQRKKREMVASAFGEDESGSRQTRLTVDDLKYLFMA